jgi:hypothetical protein
LIKAKPDESRQYLARGISFAVGKVKKISVSPPEKKNN